MTLESWPRIAVDDPPAAELGPDWSMSELRAAIGALLFDDPRTLDLRFLWSAGAVSYFRVNWWTTAGGGGRHICRSAFLQVARQPDGYRVREQHPRATA